MANSNSLGLHKYANNPDQQRSVSGKIRTSRFIQTFWRAANAKQRRDASFLKLLVQFGWTNKTKTRPNPEPTRRWRNSLIADYLRVPKASENQLAGAVHRAFPQISRQNAKSLLAASTGVTHYYTPLRTATLNLVGKKASRIRKAFEVISGNAKDTGEKVRRAAALIEAFGLFKVGRRRRVSPFNGITPSMACLDPQRRFPIMNDQTRALLRIIGKAHNTDGVVELHNLIGRYGIKDSFELDAYAYSGGFRMPKARRIKLKSGETRRLSRIFGKELGFKSEMESVALLQKKRVLITKKHNALTNKLRNYARWRHKVMCEDVFDALLENWKPGRYLLIEAKTAWSGPGGRSQIRMAIGQLFDYRTLFASDQQIDLAILTPAEPSSEIKNLARSVDIELLWFSGRRIAGTVSI